MGLHRKHLREKKKQVAVALVRGSLQTKMKMCLSPCHPKGALGIKKKKKFK